MGSSARRIRHAAFKDQFLADHEVLGLLIKLQNNVPNFEAFHDFGNFQIEDLDEVRLGERDLRRAEILSIPTAAVALVLVFGSVIAGVVPGLVGGTAVAVTLIVTLAVLCSVKNSRDDNTLLPGRPHTPRHRAVAAPAIQTYRDRDRHGP